MFSGMVGTILIDAETGKIFLDGEELQCDGSTLIVKDGSVSVTYCIDNVCENVTYKNGKRTKITHVKTVSSKCKNHYRKRTIYDEYSYDTKR